MANEKQEIVLEIHVQGSIDNLAKLRSEMDTLIKTRQDLSDKSKAGDIEATKEIEKVNSAVRNMQTEYKAQQRILDGYNASVKKGVDVNDFANNSIKTNRDLLKQLTAQYISLKAPSEAATKKIKDLSDKLKEQESAIGNNTRNVGNYKEAFSSAFGSITNAIPALQGLKTAQLGVNAAMEANPIGLVVVGIQALIGVFGSLQPVMDKIEQVTEAFSAGFGALVNGGNILEAAGQAAKLTAELQDLEDAQNGVNISNAEADAAIAQLLLQLRNKNVTEKEGREILKKLAQEDKDRLKQNEDYEQAILDKKFKRLKQQTNLEDFEIKALIERGQVKARLSKEDIAQFEAAGITEDKRNEIDKKFREAQERIANDAEHKIVKDKKEAEAAIDELAAQQQKVISIRTESALLGEKIANRESQFNDRIKTEKEKRDVEDTASNEKLKQQKEQYLKSLSALETEFNLNEREKLAKTFEDKIASITGNSERETQLRLTIAKEEVFALEKFDKDYAEKKKKIQDDLVKHNAESLAKISAQNTTSNAQHLKDEKEAADKEVEIAKQKEAFKQDLTNRLFAFTLGIINSISQAEQNASNARLEELSANQESSKEKVKADYDHKLISKKQFEDKNAAIDASFKAKEREEKKKQWEINKGIQITNAIIQTAQAVIAAFSSGAAYPFIGPATGAVFAAIAGALGAVQIGVIAAQQPPKFAHGVIGLDGEGTETSDSIDARLSKGESVITAKATKKFHRELAYMEMSVGNTPNYKFGRGQFASGFIPSPNVVSGDGGFAARDIARNSDNSALIQQAIKNGFALAPAPVLSIVEFQDKQNSRNRSVNISEA